MNSGVKTGEVYLIPSVLAEGAAHTVPAYVVDAVKQCDAFFVENERTARRFLKSIWKEMVIDNYSWYAIGKAEDFVKSEFAKLITGGKIIGIISEAGCPGIADPGQVLVAVAHKAGAVVKPLVGPSSILLVLMASGMDGQCFKFNGYLPIDNQEKTRMLKSLENESSSKRCTQVFIETPYRNNQLIETMMNTLQPATLLCVAAELTSRDEWIKTKTVSEWKKQVPQLHKKPAIFCILARG